MANFQWSRVLVARCFTTKRGFGVSSSLSFRFSKKLEQKHKNKQTVTLRQAALAISGMSVVYLGYLYYKRKASSSLSSSLETEKPRIYKDKFTSKTGQLIWLDGTWLPEFCIPDRKVLTDIENFQVNDGDVLVASFPKSGTTWIQEIIWQIVNGAESNGRTSDVNMEEKFPYLEYVYPGLKALKKRPSPRFIKTHMPYHLLPISVRQGHGKVIYIARNPKDVCVSYYHFTRMLSVLNFRGDFDHFLENFVSGRVAFGPWSDHVKQFWGHKGEENILFVSYEDLQKDASGVIRRIADFLGYRISDDQLQRIVQHTAFDTMKNDPLVNYSWWDDLGIRKKKESHFMRKGKVGDWKNYFTPAMAKEIDDKLLAPLKAVDLNFKDS